MQNKSTKQKSIKTESPAEKEKSFRAKLPFLGLLSAVFIIGGGYLYAQWELQSLGNCPNFFSLLQGRTNSQNQKECIELENKLMTSTIQFMGGAFVAFTAYVAWLNLKATEDKNVTERYTKAIEQLGSGKIEVQLGGIYALERIARDSNRDHWTIMEVLSSFIQKPIDSEKLERQGEQPLIKISQVDQAALTVIGRRKKENDPNLEETNQRIDLSKAFLAKADLSNAIFNDAILNNVILNNAILNDAELNRARLSHAELNGAELNGAELNGAILIGAKLNNAKLNNAKLSGANFRGADLSGAQLLAVDTRRASFEGAILIGAKLNGADLSNKDLRGVNFNGANLSSAKLNGAKLNGVNLSGAEISGAKFIGATLSRADLRRANLREEDFSGANFVDEDPTSIVDQDPTSPPKTAAEDRSGAEDLSLEQQKGSSSEADQKS